ncbi:hypothetical protein [Parasedimentitalea psychrophila]|uniref:Uncharacterized protein n=1 Tax=Parasedimentitalea psychrophila TaxID=2997337 RepID=A0A9Y2P0H5_9RHOB|nr:hypothetical protein [Parasedimentitalea psychrophila]WIY24601.1 hypothetical protein QPJ95_19070 [Parasedimentitalea psychrophila]
MIAKSFNQRLDRMQWHPTAVPTREIVDGILGQRPAVDLRGVGLTLLGAILGILIGVGLKGMVMPGTLWGPSSGLLGVLVGTMCIAGFVLSLPMAALGAVWHQRRPWLLPVSAMNLLMIVVILLS